MKKLRHADFVAFFACAATGIGGAASAQTIAPAIQIPAQPLGVHVLKEGKLYWVDGGGANSGIIIGQTGVIVIDAKMTREAGEELVKIIRKLTPKPITHVILTHSDGDHVNGLAGFPDALTIIAHKNNKLEQMAVYQLAPVEVDGGKCIPPSNRLPNRIVFADRVATDIDGEQLVLHYFGPAHTTGDLIVELPAYKMAYVGDIITSSVLIHPEKSGSLAGWFHTAQALLALDIDQFIGGHGPAPDTKASFRERIAGYQHMVTKIDDLVDAGKSLTEVKTAMGDPAKDQIGCRGTPFPSFSNVEFNEHADRKAELK
jgi:glyoxylase-like metal-dependent hydrolase (beta-lactamase superfamily II)